MIKGAVNFSTVAMLLAVLAVVFSMLACFYVASYIEGTKELADALNRIAGLLEKQNGVKMGGR